jgi:prophage regulatory protein
MNSLNQSADLSIDRYQNIIVAEIKKNQLLRIHEVSKLTSLGKSTINLWVAQTKFPKPIHLSPTIKVWKLEDIVLWINSQIIGETHD